MLKSLRPRAGSAINMLGHEKPLHWQWDDDKGLTVTIPKELPDAAKRPCKQAYAFRIEATALNTAERSRLIDTPDRAGWSAADDDGVRKTAEWIDRMRGATSVFTAKPQFCPIW